jgi:transposase-like protein
MPKKGQYRYSDAEKARVCAEWSISGDDNAVADRFNVKLSTLRKWKQQAWWRDLLGTMQSQGHTRLIAKGAKAMDRALDELQDRLDRGDVRVKVIGEKVMEYRQPIAARDLSSIVNVLATRSEKAQALQTQEVQNYQLSDLRDSFRQFAQSYRQRDAINGHYKVLEYTEQEQDIAEE